MKNFKGFGEFLLETVPFAVFRQIRKKIRGLAVFAEPMRKTENP